MENEKWKMENGSFERGIAPAGQCLWGDGARAGKLRQQFLESVLKSPLTVESLGVDPTPAMRPKRGRGQRVQHSKFSFSSTVSVDLVFDSVNGRGGLLFAG